MAKLNKEEKEILNAYESGKTKPIRSKSNILLKHQEYAKACDIGRDPLSNIDLKRLT